MRTKNQKERLRIGVLDIFIIAAVLVCAVSVGLRWYFTKDSVLANPTQLQPYTVNFTIKDIRATSVKYLYEGAAFYINDNGDYLGAVISVEDTPAMKEYLTSDGQHVYVPNNTEDERVNRVDISGSFAANGIKGEDGAFYLNGSRFIAPNEELEIGSKEFSVTVVIDSIVP
ncbi:MAG: hypothetical protein E7658_09370 [Ruminococcaceae bacterium]|nr:hypothetical protein [Oscillospiraceae bacterium]